MESTAVDAAWLTGALQASLGTERRVVDVVATSIGTGQVGENVRFELTWDVDTPELPASVVGKFPSMSEISRKTAVQLDTYTKEVGFYRDLSEMVSMHVPTVHRLEWDPVTHDFALLMEDIRPATSGDQLAGCTVEQAGLAVDEAVGLHAPMWGRVGSELAGLGWIESNPAHGVELRGQLIEMLMPGFVARYRGRLDEEVLAVGPVLAEHFSTWFDAVVAWAAGAGAWCLVHGDYRLDNMLFGEPPASSALTVVDWQTVGVGSGPADVAYFLGAGLQPHVRAAHERSLVERYASGLRSAGVEIDDAAVWDGYVLGSPTGYLMAALASQVVERTDRGDEMFAVMAERHAAQMRSVGLLDVLGVS